MVVWARESNNLLRSITSGISRLAIDPFPRAVLEVAALPPNCTAKAADLQISCKRGLILVGKVALEPRRILSGRHRLRHDN